MKNYFVYILANVSNTLYIGVTHDLVKRVYEHKQGFVDGFTNKYGIKKLVYFEVTTDITEAITREKQLKHWKRDWKLQLIKQFNPSFKDLYSTIR